MKVLYLDESGNHGLDTIDAEYPVFVLGGVIVDRTYARTVLAPRVRQLKEAYFGRADLVLHTADIVRAKNGFERMQEPVFRAEFFAALNAMMRELEYKVVACAIKKDEHLARHGMDAADLYMPSLGVLAERFCSEIGDALDGGTIFAETRRPDLDRELNLAWERLKEPGIRAIGPDVIDERIVDLSLKEKHLGMAGLQLADLVVSPIGRAIIGKPTREDWDIWDIVESKFRRVGTRYDGSGLVVLPE